jgi:acid phosphatase type 7
VRSPMSLFRFFVGALVVAAMVAVVGSAAPRPGQLPAPDPASPFIVEPYLQLGDVPKLAPSEPVRVLWQAPNEPGAKWSVDVRQSDSDSWRPAVGAGGRVITQMETQFRLFNVPLTRLRPGTEFEYRVSKDGAVVFGATGKTRSAADQPYHFVVTGDTGADTPQERRIVYQISRVQPDFIALAGDLVYSTGRMSEYRQKYFPIYNAPVASPETGAPLIRSRLSFGAVGNHDAGSGDLERDPDGQAFYLNWSLPLNGPYPQANLPNTQIIKGLPTAVTAHLAAIRSTFPRMANYSFDYGNSHWTFLDSNNYVDWSDAYLRNWLARDLAAAAAATWKFIVFHHPPFSSSRAHFNEQQMRLISDIAEHRGVDLVFAGHVHNYQRTRPLKFLARPTVERTFKRAGTNAIDGDFQFDESFDGVKDTTPDGVLYIVTGAGGAGAYDPDQTDNQPSWQPFTTRMVSDVYSFTRVDVNGRTLTMKQISEHGEELDRIVVTKPSRVGFTAPTTR